MSSESISSSRQEVADAKAALNKPFTIDPKVIEKKVLELSSSVVKLETKVIGSELAEKTRPYIDKLVQKGVDKIISRADTWLSKKTGIPNIGQTLSNIFSKNDTRERVGAIGDLVGNVLSKYSKGGGPVGMVIGFTIASATRNLFLSFYDQRKEILGAVSKGITGVLKNVGKTIDEFKKAPLLQKPIELIKGGLKVGVSILKGQLKTLVEVGKAVFKAAKATLKEVGKKIIDTVTKTVKDAIINPVKKFFKKLKFW